MSVQSYIKVVLAIGIKGHQPWLLRIKKDQNPEEAYTLGTFKDISFEKLKPM